VTALQVFICAFCVCDLGVAVLAYPLPNGRAFSDDWTTIFYELLSLPNTLVSKSRSNSIHLSIPKHELGSDGVLALAFDDSEGVRMRDILLLLKEQILVLL